MSGTRHTAPIREKLEEKIKILNRFVWEDRLRGNVVSDWLSQFLDHGDIRESEQMQVLFLLSHFLYFGQDEIRFLLKSLFRDFIRAPILQEIRMANAHTRDPAVLQAKFAERLMRIRFLPVGNPAESGAHILYYFRQENGLARSQFMNTHQIFKRTVVGEGVALGVGERQVTDYVFVDDFCGSGTQAQGYCEDILGPLKALAPEVRASYFVLFGTTHGLDAIRALAGFDKVDAVFVLDESFKAVDVDSRIFSGEEGPFVREKIRATCEKYGRQLLPGHPLGYKDGQLVIGFNHNTPDNTLPIFWGGREAEQGHWRAVFRRFPKVD